MQDYQKTMAFFQNAYRLCFVIAVVAFIIALLMFFVFDIRTIFLIKTGRARQKTVDEMSAKNARTGKLREDSGRTDAYTKSTGTEKAKAGRTAKVEDLSGSSPPSGTAPAEKAPKAGKKKKYEPGGQTMLLSNTMAVEGQVQPPPGNFKIIQKTIITHTDETIAV